MESQRKHTVPSEFPNRVRGPVIRSRSAPPAGVVLWLRPAAGALSPREGRWPRALPRPGTAEAAAGPA